MKKLLIATHNKAKLEEISKFLSNLAIELVSLDNVGIAQDIKETGKTFEENAILKAKYYSQKSGLPAIADDAGIEIDALNGEPGVTSKRWIGGVETSDQELIDYTFIRMKNISLEKRGAQMRVVLALADRNKIITTVEGITRGVIPDKPSTSPIKKGFPFRQVLFIPEIHKYYNQDEMTKEEELKYNHRLKALNKIEPWLHEMN